MLPITTQDIEDDVNAILRENEIIREISSEDIVSSTMAMLQNVVNDKGGKDAEQKLAELLKLCVIISY
jgi:hypothetical protein